MRPELVFVRAGSLGRFIYCRVQNVWKLDYIRR